MDNNENNQLELFAKDQVNAAKLAKEIVDKEGGVDDVKYAAFKFALDYHYYSSINLDIDTILKTAKKIEAYIKQ